MLRSVVLVWCLAVACLDSRAADSIQILSVSVGKNLMLPCPCCEDTTKLVWQIGEDIIVNHCCKYTDPLHKSYVKRTEVFLQKIKGNCSLLLHNVSLNDGRNFTCYAFDKKGNLLHNHVVVLNVTDAVLTDVILNTPQNQPKPEYKLQTRLAVGVPLSLLLLILTGLIVVLLKRKHRHRGQRMVLIQDPQAKLSIMTHSPA